MPKNKPSGERPSSSSSQILCVRPIALSALLAVLTVGPLAIAIGHRVGGWWYTLQRREGINEMISPLIRFTFTSVHTQRTFSAQSGAETADKSMTK